MTETLMDSNGNNNAASPDFPENAEENVVCSILKSLDANKYATKKTIAQGLLDVALLTANASQLKYVLQVGEKHEFYALMLTLIIISIVLQVTAACLSVVVGILMHQNPEEVSSQVRSKYYQVAWILNHISLAFVTGAMFSDVVQAILCVLLGTSLDINKSDDHSHAERANNIILCINIVLMAVNVLINSFEMRDSDNIINPSTLMPTSPGTT